MDRRRLIYTVELQMSDGSTAEIYVATFDKMKMEELIEANRFYLEMPKAITDGRMVNRLSISSFKIVKEVMTLSMPAEQYEEFVSACDIVESEGSEIQTQSFFRIPTQ